ncbi:hypothetical protein E2C01_097534 [Portunus trituberculatus]|uniref:Uncharacterized protein n=1 Tax=Portunus trituberculatus TaxID=210409 RepID=A0A5B7JYW0_PORTR|nr:hypothetical protein [Portunus trituberculatus]
MKEAKKTGKGDALSLQRDPEVTLRSLDNPRSSSAATLSVRWETHRAADQDMRRLWRPAPPHEAPEGWVLVLLASITPKPKAPQDTHPAPC